MMFRRWVANGESFTLESIALSGYLGVFLSVSVICVVWSWCCVQLAVSCATCEQLHGSRCFGANFACACVLQWSFGCTCAKCLFAWRGALCVVILFARKGEKKKPTRFLQCLISSCVSCGDWWCLNFARVCCCPMSSLAVCHCRVRLKHAVFLSKKSVNSPLCSHLLHIEVTLARTPGTSWHWNGKGIDFMQTALSFPL